MNKGHDINTCACITCDIDREILVALKNRIREPGEPAVTMKSEFPDVEEFVPVIYVKPETDEDE